MHAWTLFQGLFPVTVREDDQISTLLVTGGRFTTSPNTSIFANMSYDESKLDCYLSATDAPYFQRTASQLTRGTNSPVSTAFNSMNEYEIRCYDIIQSTGVYTTNGIFEGNYNITLTMSIDSDLTTDPDMASQPDFTYYARRVDNDPGITVDALELTVFDDGTTQAWTRVYQPYISSGQVRFNVTASNGLQNVHPALTYHDTSRNFFYDTIRASAVPGLPVPRDEYIYLTVDPATTTISGWENVTENITVHVIATPVFCSAYHTDTGCPTGWGVANATYDCVTNCTVSDCCYQCSDGFYSPGGTSECVDANCSAVYPNSQNSNQTNASTVDEACECLDGFGPQPSIQCTQQPCYDFLAGDDTCDAGYEPGIDTFSYVCVGNCTSALCCDACTPGSYKFLAGDGGCTFANCTALQNAEATLTVGATSIAEACKCLDGHSGDPTYDNCTAPTTVTPNQTCADFLGDGLGVCAAGQEPSADAFSTVCNVNCTTSDCCSGCAVGTYKSSSGTDACTNALCHTISGAAYTTTVNATSLDEACECLTGYTGLPSTTCSAPVLVDPNQTCVDYLENFGECEPGYEPIEGVFAYSCILNCTLSVCCSACPSGRYKNTTSNAECTDPVCTSVLHAEASGVTAVTAEEDACVCEEGYTGNFSAGCTRPEGYGCSPSDLRSGKHQSTAVLVIVWSSVGVAIAGIVGAAAWAMAQESSLVVHKTVSTASSWILGSTGVLFGAGIVVSAFLMEGYTDRTVLGKPQTEAVMATGGLTHGVGMGMIAIALYPPLASVLLVGAWTMLTFAVYPDRPDNWQKALAAMSALGAAQAVVPMLTTQRLYIPDSVVAGRVLFVMSALSVVGVSAFGYMATRVPCS